MKMKIEWTHLLIAFLLGYMVSKMNTNIVEGSNHDSHVQACQNWCHNHYPQEGQQEKGCLEKCNEVDLSHYTVSCIEKCGVTAPHSDRCLGRCVSGVRAISRSLHPFGDTACEKQCANAAIPRRCLSKCKKKGGG